MKNSVARLEEKGTSTPSDSRAKSLQVLSKTLPCSWPVPLQKLAAMRCRKSGWKHAGMPLLAGKCVTEMEEADRLAGICPYRRFPSRGMDYPLGTTCTLTLSHPFQIGRRGSRTGRQALAPVSLRNTPRHQDMHSCACHSCRIIFSKNVRNCTPQCPWQGEHNKVEKARIPFL